jgi:hypothetical protein
VLDHRWPVRRAQGQRFFPSGVRGGEKIKAVYMIEPVILSDEILKQARTWRDECVRAWNADGIYPRVGEAILTSPVDNKPRKVVLHLSHGFNVKGKVFVGVRSEEGEVIEEGYTIILNREKIDLQRDLLLVILLHEMTHAVDPCFDEDVKKEKENPAAFQDWTGLYGLASELRAFAAMWTDNLREDIERDEYRNPGVSLHLYRHRSHEFDGFYTHGPSIRHDLVEQLTYHFRKIAEDLNRRKKEQADNEKDISNAME